MQLQAVSLRGRRFLIQFHELMEEFAQEIPWLEGMNEIRFATNGEWFRDQLLRNLGQKNGNITPYQFVENDISKMFIGGILHFEQSPEHLCDKRNSEIAEALVAGGTSYISCLQVRNARRGSGTGKKIMQRAINAILKNHGAVWGVVSNPSLIPWYTKLGAKCLSPTENDDHLWIVYWPAECET